MQCTIDGMHEDEIDDLRQRLHGLNKRTNAQNDDESQKRAMRMPDTISTVY